MHMYIQIFFFLLIQSEFAKLEAKALSLTGGIIFSETLFAETSLGYY